MKTLFDASFKYRPAIDTNVAKTFERVRREQKAKKTAADCAPWFDDSAFERPCALVREFKKVRST